MGHGPYGDRVVCGLHGLCSTPRRGACRRDDLERPLRCVFCFSRRYRSVGFGSPGSAFSNAVRERWARDLPCWFPWLSRVGYKQ